MHLLIENACIRLLLRSAATANIRIYTVNSIQTG